MHITLHSINLWKTFFDQLNWETKSDHLHFTTIPWDLHVGEVLHPVDGIVLGLILLSITPQGIGLLTGDRIVPGLKLVLSQPERHNQPNEEADEASRGDVHSYHEHVPMDLDSHLLEPGRNVATLEAISKASVVLPTFIKEVEG